MEDAIYKAPAAELDPEIEKGNANNFYVVGLWKVTFLYLLTLGIYSIYWFYRNWKIQKQRYNLEAIPVLRGIFQIFFTHSLCSAVDDQIQDRKIEYTWHPQTIATLYVIALIADSIFDRMLGEQATDFLISYIPLLVSVIPMLLMQRAINIAEGDPKGQSNSSLTPFNILWALPGILLYGLLTLAIYAASTGTEF